MLEGFEALRQTLNPTFENFRSTLFKNSDPTTETPVYPTKRPGSVALMERNHGMFVFVTIRNNLKIDLSKRKAVCLPCFCAHVRSNLYHMIC